MTNSSNHMPHPENTRSPLDSEGNSNFNKLSAEIKKITQAGFFLLMSAVSTNAMASEVKSDCGLVGVQFYDQQDKEGMSQYESQTRAIDFLKQFPESICDSNLVSVISEGEQEWTGNGQKLGKFYSYLKKFREKDKFYSVRIRNMEENAPEFWSKLIKNKYLFFIKLKEYIELQESREELKALKEENKKGRKLNNFLRDNS